MNAVFPQPRVQDSPPPDARRDVAALVRRQNVESLDHVLDVLIDVLLQGDLPHSARAELAAYLSDGRAVNEALDRRVRETAHAIMTMPEYQLA
jgi:hypothetical protein